MNFNQQSMAQGDHKQQNVPYCSSDFGYGSMSTLNQSTIDLATSMSTFSELGSLMTLKGPDNSIFEEPQVLVNLYIYQSLIYMYKDFSI